MSLWKLEVITEPKGSIGLRDHFSGAGPGAGGFLNDPLFQHAIPSFLIYHPMQHPLECLIEPLHKSISLRKINGCSEAFDL